ncbi:MAG TPA: TonB-dependent receptor [Pyrinomonadaceae bacterium]|jgi:hypothetical protein|nr:TonB-dependent receptor [Pyrinomonadaceae bacterium]
MLCAVGAQAQFRAGVQGTVTDATGAVIPEATVTLTNNETNRTQTTTSNEEGFYRFTGLAPGRYNISAEKTGFKKSVLENFVVNAEETQGADVVLSTGEVAESVTVTSNSAQALETENANITRAITTQEVLRLPQAGRDPYELVRLTPGVFGDAARSSSGTSSNLPSQVGPGGSNTSIFQTENQVQVTANGQRVSANNYQIDGVSVNSLGKGGAAVVTPNQESVKEVRVKASTYSAEDGRNSGAQVQVVSQNGTNTFHGSLFYKYNDPALNAFNKFPTPQRVQQRFRQFGGSLGGRIIRDKLFFFLSYEGLRNNETSFRNNVVVETPEFRQYIQQVRPNSLAARLFGTEGIAPRIQAVVPTACPGLPPGSVCQQLPGGLDIGSLNLARPTGFYYGFDPVINGSNQAGGGLDGIPDIQFVNLFVPNTTRANQLNSRIDYSRGNDQFAVSTYFTRRNDLAGSTNGRPLGDLATKPLNSAATATWTRVLSSNMLNEARFNFTRFAFNQVESSEGTNFGIPFFNIFDFDTPVRCCMNIGAERGGTTPGIFAQNTYEFSDTLRVTSGNHALAFGAIVRKEQDNNNLQGGARPLFQFSSFLNFANDAPQFESIDFDPRTGALPNGQRYFRSSNYAFFAQDDWKFRPNLSLNLGLRYEYFSPLSEKEGRTSNYIFGPNGLTDGRVEVTDELYAPDRNNFAPRLGFAWSPMRFQDRLVVRGGFGINYNRLFNDIISNVRGNPPFFARAGLCCGDAGNQGAGSRIFYTFGTDNTPFGYPANPALAVGIDPATGAPRGVAVEVFGALPNLRNAYVYSYSLETQYQFPFYRLVGSIGYQGSSSHKLTRTVDLNRFFPGDTFDNVRDRIQTRDVNGNPVTPRRTGNPAFDRIFFPLSDVNANYNAMNLRLTRQFADGFQLDGIYTWSKSIDTTSFEIGAQQTDPSRPDLERGPSDYDVRHRVTVSGIWDLPLFRNRTDALGKVFGGFQINGILTAHTGFPFTPQVFGPEETDLNGDGFRPDRPTRYFGGVLQNPSNQDFINGIFPRDAAHPRGGPDYFDTVTRGPAGIGRNVFRGPRYFVIDLSLVKATALPNILWLGEAANLQLRANFFNAFNTLNLEPFRGVTPNVDIGNPVFGRATGALAGRVIELQARFSF